MVKKTDQDWNVRNTRARKAFSQSPFIKSPSAMALLWARAVSEAVYYIDEVSTETVPVEAKMFVVNLLTKRLQLTSDGFITFDGKMLAHINDAQP